MIESVTAKQLIEHLSPYDLDGVRFQMADGLPVVAVYIHTDEGGGAMITLSDVPFEDDGGLVSHVLAATNPGAPSL